MAFITERLATDGYPLPACFWLSPLRGTGMVCRSGARSGTRSGGCVILDAAACGLRWKDQLKREKRQAARAAEAALDTDVAVAAAAVQKQLDDAAAAAATAQVAPERGATEPWQCQHCSSRDMFCHRPGPGGMGTLCNGTL